MLDSSDNEARVDTIPTWWCVHLRRWGSTADHKGERGVNQKKTSRDGTIEAGYFSWYGISYHTSSDTLFW